MELSTLLGGGIWGYNRLSKEVLTNRKERCELQQARRAVRERHSRQRDSASRTQVAVPGKVAMAFDWPEKVARDENQGEAEAVWGSP